MKSSENFDSIAHLSFALPALIYEGIFNKCPDPQTNLH